MKIYGIPPQGVAKQLPKEQGPRARSSQAPPHP